MSEQAAGELRATLIGNGRAWLRFRWAAAEPGPASRRHTSPHASTPSAAGVEGAGGTCRGAGGRRQGLAGLRGDTPVHTPARQAPPVWRAPEEPEGTGGLRGAAPNEVRTPSLAGGRGLRRPKHPRRHTQGHSSTDNKTRPRPVSRPRPRHAHAAPLSKAARRRSAPFTTAPAIRRSCPRGPRPRRGQPRGGRRGRGTESRTRSPGPRHGRSGSTAGRHRARHTRRA